MSFHPAGPVDTRWSIAVVGALLLVGCGDGGRADTSGSVPQHDPGSATTTSTPASTTGGSPKGTNRPTTTTSPAPTADGAGGAISGVTVKGRKVASLKAPTMLLPRPKDPTHLYASERAGTIRRLTIGSRGALTVDDATLLDLTDQTTTDGERGLLSFAFSRDGATIYVSHTDKDGNTRLASYAMEGDEIDVSTRQVLLAQDQPFANHNGGLVLVGPDAKLWFGFGDGGAGDDPSQHAQDPSTLLGKIVRLDPSAGKAEIVISGVRNPWRFSFDTDGSLWIGDVGQNQWEEIDHLPAGRIEGANLGWSGREGTHPNAGVPDGERTKRTGNNPIEPVLDYSHDGGNCSVTGGFVYRGKAIPALEGAYLFADYCAGRLRAMTVGADGRLAKEVDLGVDVAQPISFGSDGDGEPFVLSQDGSVVRLVPAG
ncbi:MAG: PQQ-dependent sugar dehydrogenase [Acidimicrobiales bacterium]